MSAGKDEQGKRRQIKCRGFRTEKEAAREISLLATLVSGKFK
ncbi:Arm DNA-binding domain-containing protein [Paenibacillus thiaminolyticus]|uniref:Arm DNA-binding domain-containing protein n=1 Tax=Paenibacillus thiaminolyticus TaxID=49283 RepID=A0AAP9J3P0_PANTH|nr:Arm DNA-binding domain-containing protein [Paenibacillus thiaminolyticus]MCY9603399.1 Arm DNA-binding domain-containing protein [Paenibacillus thiaminolyticus]MCY9610616.1 Arm DNA-binding domain-containing protein [Paenibacillus thiaminolyticus]MCY9616416.1 Arm DNA-binding domain-containing protein [Paenibacillus thiaminolyticus]MCY9621300.1 Arm DNA-binding domain-containing protein [Paenibacillus thiaminolyticus]